MRRLTPQAPAAAAVAAGAGVGDAAAVPAGAAVAGAVSDSGVWWSDTAVSSKKETTPRRVCEREGVVTCYYRPECYPLVKRNKQKKKKNLLTAQEMLSVSWVFM